MKYQDLFNGLESSRHNKKVQFSLFDNTPETNADYWLASDLQKLLHKQNMPWHNDMHADILKSLSKVAEQYPAARDINPCEHLVPITSAHGHKTYDVQLSRYAAWALVAKNPLLACACAYFLMPDANMDKLFYTAIEISRAQVHETLAVTNRRIAGMLKQNNINPREFYANVYSTFFGRHTVNDIKQQHRIPIVADDSIQHYMGATTIYEFSRALASIRSEFDICKNRTPDALYRITTTKMQDARRAVYVALGGNNPEQVITTKSITETRGEVQKIEMQFIKKFKDIKIATL